MRLHPGTNVTSVTCIFRVRPYMMGLSRQFVLTISSASCAAERSSLVSPSIPSPKTNSAMTKSTAMRTMRLTVRTPSHAKNMRNLDRVVDLMLGPWGG